VCCEYDTEPSGSINGWEFPDQFGIYRLLKKAAYVWGKVYNTHCLKEAAFGGGAVLDHV
jgi:hypothetical protein